MNRRPWLSHVARHRLSQSRLLHTRYRWLPNFTDFSKLMDAGIIVIDPDILEELVREAMNHPLGDIRYIDPSKKPVSDE